MPRSRPVVLSALAAAGLLSVSSSVAMAQEPIVIDAASVPITIDADVGDWAEVEPTTVSLRQLDLSLLPPEQADEINYGAVDPIDVQFRVANDADNIYMLVEVPTAYDYVADDHNLSPALAVQAKVVPEASTHMGAEESDLYASTGMVDMWHWELDCAPGELNGGGATPEGVVTGTGNDEPCNMDDEVSLTPEMRWDDGGDEEMPNEAAENSLLGSWSHTAAEIGGDGTWIFEMARPLSTGDPEDAQWEAGGSAELVLAWWDPNETSEGWTDAGHLTNSYDGWIAVNLN